MEPVAVHVCYVYDPSARKLESIYLAWLSRSEEACTFAIFRSDNKRCLYVLEILNTKYFAPPNQKTKTEGKKKLL